MPDFFEIDFMDVESSKSGDAIPLRYALNGVTSIHVVDGGFQATGESVVAHLIEHYGSPNHIDHVVVTHPDGDHAGGLRTVLESFSIGTLWMLRPWEFATEIIDRFENFTSIPHLTGRLRQVYPNIAALEEIAIERGIPIANPFQGASIGAFSVLAPTKKRYLDLIVASEKTPESVQEAQKSALDQFEGMLGKAAAFVVALVKAAWGHELFSLQETSAENEMSVIQYANLCGKRILLTGDAGREALTEAVEFAPAVGLALPGIDRFQVPHHGSRRNVSTELLDRLLGERLSGKPVPGAETFGAYISAANADEHHPRKAVVRALIHRGARVLTTKSGGFCTQVGYPVRTGWVPLAPVPYPEEQEE